MAEEEKKEKKPKSKARKIIGWVITGIFVFLFGFVAVMQITAFATKGNNHGVPNYFGNQILIILTDSMEPEYKINGAVIVKKVEPSEFKIDDDVTFIWNVNGYDTPMTHRLIEVYTPVETGTGHYKFVTHGINKESKQCAGNPYGTETADCTYQTQTFDETVVLGKVVGYSMALGVIFNFMTTPWGLISLLLIPALYLIISSVIDIIRAAKDDDEEELATAGSGDPNDVLAGLSEEDRQRLKEELLNEMIEEKMKGDKKDE